MPVYDFRQWLNVKNSLQEDFDSPEDPSNMFKFNTQGPASGDDYENTQKEVIKVVTSKYQHQFMRFLNDLAEEH